MTAGRKENEPNLHLGLSERDSLLAMLETRIKDAPGHGPKCNCKSRVLATMHAKRERGELDHYLSGGMSLNVAVQLVLAHHFYDIIQSRLPEAQRSNVAFEVVSGLQLSGDPWLTGSIEASADAYLDGMPEQADNREGMYNAADYMLGGGVLLVRVSVPDGDDRSDWPTFSDLLRHYGLQQGKGRT